MSEGAFAVHGLGDDFLRDKPVFRQVAQAFLDFVGDARLVIHNAAFDMKFINAELGWAGLTALSPSTGRSIHWKLRGRDFQALPHPSMPCADASPSTTRPGRFTALCSTPKSLRKSISNSSVVGSPISA